MSQKSEGEETFALLLTTTDLPIPEREYMFAKSIGRRWRFDFAWPDSKIAVEIEGGTWTSKSRHTTGKGFMDDCEKYNAAAEMGWRVFRFTTDMVTGGVDQIERVLKEAF